MRLDVYENGHIEDIEISVERARRTLDYHCMACGVSFSRDEVDDEDNPVCPNCDCNDEDVEDFYDWTERDCPYR